MTKKQREMDIAENPLYHDTWKLLKKYRDVVWSLELSVQQVRNRFEIEYGSSIDDFLESVYLAGADIAGGDIEHHAKCIERSNRMIKLLWGKECIVQEPVIGLPVLVLIPEQFHRAVKQLDHPVAALYTLGMVLNVPAGNVRPRQVHRFQEVLYGTAILDLKPIPHLLYRKLQAPDHIPVFLQQFPCITIHGNC